MTQIEKLHLDAINFSREWEELGNLEDAFYEGIGSDKYQQEYGENARGSMLPQQYIKETYGIDK